MYYKIGTLAKRFGITTQALRFYESRGFLVPIREDSTTRKYQTRNLKWLSSIRRYHKLGFGMEEIQKLFLCEDMDQLKQWIKEKEVQTQTEMEMLEKRLRALKLQQMDMKRIDQLFRRCELKDSPCLWLLIDQEGQQLDESPETEKLIQAWTQELDFVHSASVVPKEAVLSDDTGCERKSGFCIQEEMALQLGLPEGRNVVHVKMKNCIHTVTRLSEREPFLAHAAEYAAENRLQITGDAVGRCLIKVGEAGCQDGQIIPKAVYYEYWIPAEKIKALSADQLNQKQPH